MRGNRERKRDRNLYTFEDKRCAHWNSSSELRSIVFSVYARREGSTVPGGAGIPEAAPAAAGAVEVEEDDSPVTAAVAAVLLRGERGAVLTPDTTGLATVKGIELLPDVADVCGGWCNVGVIR